MKNPEASLVVRLVLTALAAVSVAACGLIDAGIFDFDGSGIICDEDDVCTCDLPDGETDGEFCLGTDCVCDDGSLDCEAPDADCVVTDGTGTCFNGFCECESGSDADPGESCDCQTPGTCTSTSNTNVIIVEDGQGGQGGCSGECTCSSNVALGCRCTNSRCLILAAGIPCVPDGPDVCGDLSRAQKVGCVVGEAPPQDGCVDGELCIALNVPGAEKAACFRRTTPGGDCDEGFVVATVSDTSVCLTDSLPPAVCDQGVCVDNAPGG